MGTDYRSFPKRWVERDVLDLARERTADAFDRFDTISVSFSGGKDSTAVINLVMDEAERRPGRRIIVQFNDEEVIPFETLEYVERTRAEMYERLGRDRVEFGWYAMPFKFHNVASRREPWWWTWDPAKEDLWIRPKPPEAITDHPRYWRGCSWGDFASLSFDTRTLGAVGSLLGIRADESPTRHHAVAQKAVDNYIIPARTYQTRSSGVVPGVMKVYPIYDWSDSDVWTAPGKLGWDYNRSYDLLDQAGIALKYQRLGPPFAAESIRGLQVYAQCFPEVWERLCRRVPGVLTAYRYASTELYDYRSTPEPGPGQTWDGLVKSAIDKWAPDMRPIVESKVRFYVQYHYRRTNDPIIDVAHPLTGISWPWLVKVAVRGDLKERMRPMIINARRWSQKNPHVHEEAMARWRSKISRSASSDG